MIYREEIRNLIQKKISVLIFPSVKKNVKTRIQDVNDSIIPFFPSERAGDNKHPKVLSVPPTYNPFLNQVAPPYMIQSIVKQYYI